MDTMLHQQLQWVQVGGKEQRCLQRWFCPLSLWIVRPFIMFSPVNVRKKVNFVRSIFFFSSNERSSAGSSLLFVKFRLFSSYRGRPGSRGHTSTINQLILCSFKTWQPSSHLIPLLPEPARETICMRGLLSTRGCPVAHTQLDGDGRSVCCVTWA